jgi:hypothetical protein
MDGTIPRQHLAHVLARIAELSQQYGLRVANVFHAGDGNLHPLILFDANQPDEMQRAEDFGTDILKLCVEVGGTVTGEHGVGVEKLDATCSQFTRKNWPSSTPSRPPSTRTACSIPARPCRRCIAARKWAACMCRAGICRFPNCRGSRDDKTCHPHPDPPPSRGRENPCRARGSAPPP